MLLVLLTFCKPSHLTHTTWCLCLLSPPPWWREGSWSRLSAASWRHGLLFLFTRGRHRRIVRGGQRVAPPLTPITGGGVIISRCNLDSRLIGIWRFVCRGLNNQAQVNAWLSYSSIFSIICAMYSLDSAGTSKLKTHFGCGMLLLVPFLGGISCQLLSKDILEERKGANIGENTILYSISRSCENLYF